MGTPIDYEPQDGYPDMPAVAFSVQRVGDGLALRIDYPAGHVVRIILNTAEQSRAMAKVIYGMAEVLDHADKISGLMAQYGFKEPEE